MDTETLRLFLAVADAGGFAAAARRMDLDPSSASRGVAALEAQLGVRLFHRTTRKLSLTEAGARYRDRLAPILDALNDAREEARDATATLKGALRVTTSVAFGVARLTPLLPAFRAEHPDLSIELVLSDEALDLTAHKIDVAIRLGPAPTGDGVVRRLMSTRHRAVASPHYLRTYGAPKNPAEMAERDCLVFLLPGFRPRWRFRDADGAVTETPVREAAAMSNALALRAAACDGLGPALLADWLIDDDIAAGRLVDLFPDHQATATQFDTAAWLMRPSRAYSPRKTRLFMDVVIRAMARKQ